jgi:ABC-2 type transport system ATP-binding protein
MIEVRDLHKQFGSKKVLNGVSFGVGEGEVFGYLGPNGAGKTTTMRCLLGLIRPTSGSALVWGQDLGTRNDLRARIGVLLESDGLYERLSAQANLDYFARLYGVSNRAERVRLLLDFAGLSRDKDRKVGQFSRGMKRKLALARALIHQPGVLFMDEPTAGLDPEAQKMVRDLVLQLSRDEHITVFLNSHDLDEVERVCSRVAILKEGEVRASDTMENLRSKYGTPVVRIGLPGQEEAGRVARLLESLDYVTASQSAGSDLRVKVDDPARSSQLLSFLVEKGVTVSEVTREGNSLEDVYLKIVTGEAVDA